MRLLRRSKAASVGGLFQPPLCGTALVSPLDAPVGYTFTNGVRRGITMPRCSQRRAKRETPPGGIQRRGFLLVGRQSPLGRTAFIRPLHALAIVIPQGRIDGPDQVNLPPSNPTIAPNPTFQAEPMQKTPVGPGRHCFS